MAESQNITTVPATATQEDEKKPSLFTRIRTEHPRKVKAAVITAAVLAAGVVGVVVGKNAGSDSSSDSGDVYDGEFNLDSDTLSSEV